MATASVTWRKSTSVKLKPQLVLFGIKRNEDEAQYCIQNNLRQSMGLHQERLFSLALCMMIILQSLDPFFEKTLSCNCITSKSLPIFIPVSRLNNKLQGKIVLPLKRHQSYEQFVFSRGDNEARK